MATGPAVPGGIVPDSSLSELVLADSEQLGGESTQSVGTFGLGSEQLGGESAQAVAPPVVGCWQLPKPVPAVAGDINSLCEGVGAETGGEGSGCVAWVGVARVPLKQCYVCLERPRLPCPLPSSPKSLRSRAVKATAVAGRRQAKGSGKKSSKVLNRI